MGKTKKQIKKILDGKCFFCGESNYKLLDLHRIVPGSEDGKYSENNILCCCANCHRRVHSEEIVIDRKYPSTSGGYVLHYFREGKEFWENIT